MGVLEGKIVVITGASRGLGEAMAVAFAREGATLVLGARTEADLDRVAARCREMGATVDTVVTDVTDAADIQRLVQTAIDRHASIDIFMNNAGVGVRGLTETRYPDVASVDLDIWEALLRTNATSQFLGLKYAAPAMRPGGTIINVGSETAHQPSPGNGVYAASKAISDSLTQTTAVELGKRGIRVNSLSPGKMTDTQLFGPEGMPEGMKARIPYMVADEIGAAAVWLASDASADVSGVFVSAFLFNTLGESAIRERMIAGDKGWGR